MGLGDFWLQFNNGKKEQLKDAKHGVRKEQLDHKYQNLFDAFDINGDGTLENNELETIVNWTKKLSKGDNILNSNENLQAKSIFSEQINIPDADFQGFVQSLSKASEDIVATTEKSTPDGGKEITTEYKDGSVETISYYPDGSYKYKKFDHEYTENTIWFTFGDDQINQYTESQIEGMIRKDYQKLLDEHKKALAEYKKNELTNKELGKLPPIAPPKYKDYKSIYIEQNNICQNSSNNRYEIHNLELSERAKFDVSVREFLLQHYIDTNQGAKEALDTMGILDDIGAAINAGAGELWNACKNIYNKHFGNGTEQDYQNFYELLQKFSPSMAQAQNNKMQMTAAITNPALAVKAVYNMITNDETSELGSYEKSLLAKGQIEYLNNHPDAYFNNFETDFLSNTGQSYDIEKALIFQETTETYQSATILDSRISILKAAMQELDMYWAEYNALVHSPAQSEGINPYTHITKANSLLLQYFNGDQDAVNMVLNGSISDPMTVQNVIKGIKEDNEKQLNYILNEKSLDDIKTNYANQYKDIYGTDFVPDELTEKVMDAKATGGMVKIAAITIISILITRSPIMLEISGAAAGSVEATGAAANFVRTLVAKYGQTAVQQAIKFAMTTGTVATDTLLTLFNQVTSERGINGEELWESTKGAAKYIYFGAYIGSPVAQAVSQRIGQIGVAGKLMNGGVKTTNGAVQTTTISGDKLLANIRGEANGILAKSKAFLRTLPANAAGFATDVGMFTGLEIITEGADPLTAGAEQSEMLGKLKVMNHFLEYMLGAKTHTAVNKARWDAAVERSGVKNWNIKEVKAPTSDGKGMKTTYYVDIDGIPIGRFENADMLTTAMMERVSSIYSGTDAPREETARLETEERMSEDVIRNLQRFVNSNSADNVISKSRLNLTQFGKNGIPLKYSRESFIQDLDALLSTLTPEERIKIETDFGIKIKNTTYNDSGKEIVGIPSIPKDFEGTPNEQAVARLIKKFTIENEVTIADVETKALLESILKTFPEFAMTIGKKQHGTHDFSVDVHTLRNLQDNLANPKYAELDAESQLVLKYATILHDIGKRFLGDKNPDHGHAALSTEYTAEILKRFDLSDEVKARIIKQVKNHHWFEEYNKGNQTPELVTKVVETFGTIEDFTIAEIMAKSDYMNVNDNFHLNRARSRVRGDGLMSETEFENFMTSSFEKIENEFKQKAENPNPTNVASDVIPASGTSNNTATNRISFGLETDPKLASLSDNEIIELFKDPKNRNPQTSEETKYLRTILAELVERGYKAEIKDNDCIITKLSEVDISARVRFAKLIENEQPMRKLFTLNNICENNFETEVQSVKQKLLSKYTDLLAEGDLLDLKKYIDANPDKIAIIDKLMPALKEIEEGKSRSGWGVLGDNEKGKEYKDLIDCLDNLTPEKAELIDDYISIAKVIIDGSFNRPKNLSDILENLPVETCRAVAGVMKDIPDIASNIDNAALLGMIKEKSPNSYKLVADFISRHKDYMETLDYEYIFTNLNITETYLINIEKNINVIKQLKEKFPQYEEIIGVREETLLNSQDIERYKAMEKFELLKELDTLFPQEWGRSLSEALFNPRNPHFLVEETLENVKTKVELAKILGAIKVERKGEQISVFNDESYNYHYQVALDVLIRHLNENPDIAEADIKNIIDDFKKLAEHKVTSILGKEESLLGAYIEPDTYAVRYLQNKNQFRRADDIINTAKFIDKYKFKDTDKYKAEAFTAEELSTMEAFAEKFAELNYKFDNDKDVSISDLFTLEEMREISHKSLDELNEKISFLKNNNLDIRRLKDKSLVRWALLNKENVGSSSFDYVKNRVLNSTQENQSPDFSIKTKSDLKMYLMSLKNKNGDSVFNPELAEKVKPEMCQIVAQMAYELSKQNDVPLDVLENILTKTATEYNINETSIKVAISRANVYKELLKHDELKGQDLSQIYLKAPENGVELIETYFKNPNLPKNARDMADILDKAQFPEAVDFYGELLQKGYEIDDADVFVMHCRDKSEIEISKILMDNIPNVKNFVEYPQYIMAYRNLPVEIVRIIADNKPELLSDRQFSQELHSATYQFNKNGFDISKVKDNINVFKNMSTETVKTFSKKIIEGLCSDSVKMSDINEVAEILNSNLTKEQIADFSWRFNDQEDFGLLASNLKKFAEFKILGLDGKPQSILKYFDYDTINKILSNYTSPEKIDKFYDILKKLQETRLSDTDNRSLLDIMQLKNSFQLADMDNLNAEKLVQILKENPDFANGLNPKSLVLVNDFADFYGKNIYELSKTEKRNLLMTVLKNKNRLTSGNTRHLKNMSLMPTNNEEYVAIMKDISRSLNISLEVLPDEKIAEFNTTLNSLENYLKTANLGDLNDINLMITHKEFISQIQDILKDLPNSEKAKIQDLFGFKIVDDKLTGYPNNSVEIDLTSITNPKSREAARLVKEAISQYTNNNFITVKDNPELNARLKEISEIMPEIFNQIDGSKDSVVMIKTLQRIVQNPKYNKLSESDKRVLTVATLLHNTDKTSASTGESAFDAYFIAKKFNMSDTEAQKVYSIIENSDLINKFMATSKKETVRNYRGTRINGSEREDTFDLIAFKLKEGNLFELTQMLYSAKEEDGFTRHFDKLLENRIREMKSNDFVLPQTPRSAYHDHAEIMTIPYGDNEYQVKVVYAEDIENFYALIHTPEAGYATGGTRDANFANFEAFRVLNDDKVICTSYVSNGTAGLVKEYHYGFIFDVANDKQYVGYGTDIYSLGKNIPDMVVEYFRDKGIKANRNRGGKFDHRTMISNTLKTLLYGTDYYKLSKSVADQVAVIDNKYNTEIEKLSKARKQFFTERFGTAKITYEQYVSVRNDAKLVNIENQIRQLQQQKRVETEQVQGYSTLKEMDAKYAERLEKIKSQLGNETMSIENLEKIDPEFASAYKEFLSRDGSEHKEDASLLRSGWHNEVLISNPEISAIFTDDISSIPEEYLIKAQEEDLPIVIIR